MVGDKLEIDGTVVEGAQLSADAFVVAAGLHTTDAWC